MTAHTAGASDAAAALAALEQAVPSCLLADRRRIARKLARLRKDLQRAWRSGSVPSAFASRLLALDRACASSTAVVAARRALMPDLVWPEALPIAACRAQLAELLAAHQVLVISGATGSGKSTQLPKLCLAAGRGIFGRIGHTQPRRIAARAIAERIAFETKTPPGVVAGHSIRFDDNLSPTTRIKVMTDGILLNEIHSDPWLLQYDTLIIDEVHERTLNIDFLLGYLRRILPRRPDLKLLITSATFDTATFARFFAGAAVFEVAGRAYPIETRYRPLADDADDADDADGYDALIEAIAELDAEACADVLVFLPGEREIREAAARLAHAKLPDTEVLQLFARLGAARQARIFTPGAQRRVVLATNVAETSLTVPRIRHVIDTGLARVSRYSPRRKLQQLPIESIARANADQRRGRCGREAPGICIRLYSEADYAARRPTIEPEIQRTHLAGVILKLKALGVDDIGHFAFIERPADRLLKDAYSVLQEIGALDESRAVSPLGRMLVTYPVDPRLARVLVAAADLGCLAEMLIVVAALSIVDPRERPHELRDLADRAHARFADKRSDFLWFVNAWPFAQEMQTLPLPKQLRRCRRAFLAAARIKEWVELHAYLTRLSASAGLMLNSAPGSYRAMHVALLTGFPTFVAEWQQDHYSGCRNAAFALHPASTLARRGVKWILAGDVVETARPYARFAARIDPVWVEQAAGHLIKRNYEAPHWDARRGCARVTEIQRLFGLVLQADRVIDLARVDVEQARALLIEHGLVDGELGESPEFLDHNRALVARVQALEARARRRDLVAPRAHLCAFYADRLPHGIHSRRDLLRWLRSDSAHEASLFMSEADATSDRIDDVPAYLFPDCLEVAGTPCAVDYRFEPGHPRDGITVSVPEVLLPCLDATAFDRLVPGLTSAKVEQLLRSLPKAERRRFSPLREFAMAATEAIAESTLGLPDALAAALSTMTGEAVNADLFDECRMPDHLRCNIDLIDVHGAVVASGRDLDVLRSGRGAAAQSARAAIDWALGGCSRGGWTFADVPVMVETAVGTSTIRGFPALADCGDRVELCVYDNAEQAARMHLGGLARLFLLGAARELRYLERTLPDLREMALLAVLFGYRSDPVRYLAQACAQRWATTDGELRTAAGFMARAQQFNQALVAEVTGSAARLYALLRRGAALRRRLDDPTLRLPRATQTDLALQLGELLGPAVVPQIDRDGAPRHDRYLAAIERRLVRVSANPGKDLQKLEQLAPLWQRFLVAAPQLEPEYEPALESVRTLFEEFRISLFAPELGTACKVSAARLSAALDTLDSAPHDLRRAAVTEPGLE